MTGKTTTRKRSARPAFSKERHRVRLPMVRIDLAAVSFISRTASTGSSATSCVFAQERGSLSVVEQTTFAMPARASQVAAPAFSTTKAGTAVRTSDEARTHRQQIFPKLGITSRAALRDALAGYDAGTSNGNTPHQGSPRDAGQHLRRAARRDS